jgi:predicted nucleic acid-binding protein
MKRPRYLFDTCSYVLQFRERRFADLIDQLLLKGQFVLSSIVAMELYAGARDEGAKRALDRLSLQLDRLGCLVVPDYADYQKAGLLIRHYARRKGALRTSPHFRDILILLNAFRAEAVVVTENLQDFLRWRSELKRTFHRPISVVRAEELL